MSNERQLGIRRLGEVIEKLFLPSPIIQTLVFVIIAFTAIFAISEIAARENVLALLTSQASALKSEFVEQSRGPTETVDKDTAIQIKEDRARLLKEIRKTETLRRSLQTLIALGSDDPQFSMRAFQQVLADLGSRNQPRTYLLEMARTFWLFSSDELLAIAVMTCGAVGAMVASLRGGSAPTLRSLCLGLASGFVVYLAIKGGRHVFLLQSHGEIVAFNPYGSAFAGLLGGLFTEKAHQLLATVVDDFLERVRAATSGRAREDAETKNERPGTKDV